MVLTFRLPVGVIQFANALVAGGDWKLAMTPENIRPLFENARECCACVEELGKLKEMVVAP